MVKESNGDETLIENLGQVDNDATLVTKNTTQGHEESQKTEEGDEVINVEEIIQGLVNNEILEKAVPKENITLSEGETSEFDENANPAAELENENESNTDELILDDKKEEELSNEKNIEESVKSEDDLTNTQELKDQSRI